MARRVNTRFVTILLTSALGLGAVIWVAQTFLIRDHADVHWRAAQLDLSSKPPKLDDAVIELNKAARLSPRDVKIQNLLGKIYSQLAITDASNLVKERAAYENVLQIDPNDLEALLALIRFWQDLGINSRRPDWYDFAGDYARRAAKADAAVIAAKAKMTPPEQTTLEEQQELLHLQSLPAIMVVQKAQLGLDNDPAKLQGAIGELQVLLDQYKQNATKPGPNPFNAEIPFYVAAGKCVQAATIISQSDRQELVAKSKDKLNEAVAAFVDPYLLPRDGDPTTRPDQPNQMNNSELHYQFAKALEIISSAQGSEPEVQAQTLKQARNQLDIEVDPQTGLAKPQDGLYLEISLYAADFYFRNGRKIYDQDGEKLGRTKAIQILQGILPSTNKDRGYPANYPLAKYLAADGDTAKGMDVLGEAIDGMGGVDRMTPYMFRFIDLQTRLRIDEYGRTKDPAVKKQLGDEIQYVLAKMKERLGNTPSFSTIQEDQAQFYLADLNYIDAIPILQQLVSTNTSMAHDPQVLISLADAYEKAGQSADAITYFSKLVTQYPDRPELRKPLVRIMLQHTPDQVEPQLEALEKLAPTDPEVIFDRIDVLYNEDPKKNKNLIEERLKKIPETTDTEIVQKSRRELMLQDWDDAAGLLSKFLDKHPGDVLATRELAICYEKLDQKDKAAAVVSAAIKANPQSTELQELAALLNGATQAQINEMVATKINNESDPGTKALELADQDNRANNVAKAEADLLEGERKTTNTEQLHLIWAELFQVYIHTGNLNAAQGYLDKIAKANLDRVGGELYHFKLMQAKGDKAAELDIARQLAKEHPDFAPVFMDLGEALKDNEQYDAAIIQYSAALAKQPDNLQGIVGVVQCDYALDKKEDALAEIKQGLAKIPDNSELRMLLLKHEYTYGSYDEGMAAVDSELRRQSDNRELWAAKGLLFYRGGRLAEASNDMDLAKERYKNAMDTLNQARKTWGDDGTINNAMVDLLVDTRNYSEAEKVLQEWCDFPKWKTRPEPFQKMANFYDQLGQQDLAEKAMQVAYTNSNFRIDYQLQMSDMLSRHKKYDVALGLLEATNSGNSSIRRAIIVTLAQMPGRFDDAQAKLQEAMNSNPARPASLLTLWAQLLLNQNRFDSAIDKASQALNFDPKDTEAHYIRASANFFKRPTPDYQAALNDLSLIGSSPEAKVHTMKADCYLRLNDVTSATAELLSALKDAPQNKLVRMKLVEIYTTGTRQHTAEALSLLKDAEGMVDFQKDPEIYKTEADILLGQKNQAGAMEKSQKALQLTDPKDSEAYGKVLRQYLDVLVKVNQVALLHETEGSVEVNQKNWWFMLDRGLAKQAIRDTDGAKADLNTALADAESDKDSTAAPTVLDAIVKQIGVDEAIAMVRPIAASHTTARVSLALLLMKKGQPDAAVSEADSVMVDAANLTDKDKDDRIRIYSTLPRVYLGASPHPLVDKAIDCYVKSLDLDPNLVVNLNDLACVLVDMCTPPKAKDALVYAQRAVDTLRDQGHPDANITDTLGWVLVQNGDLDKGISMLQGVISDRPFPTAYLHLGEAYLKAGHPDAGLAAANEGLKSNEKAVPPDQAIEAKLGDLKGRCNAAVTKASASN